MYTSLLTYINVNKIYLYDAYLYVCVHICVCVCKLKDFFGLIVLEDRVFHEWKQECEVSENRNSNGQEKILAFSYMRLTSSCKHPTDVLEIQCWKKCICLGIFPHKDEAECRKMAQLVKLLVSGPWRLVLDPWDLHEEMREIKLSTSKICLLNSCSLCQVLMCVQVRVHTHKHTLKIICLRQDAGKHRKIFGNLVFNVIWVTHIYLFK